MRSPALLRTRTWAGWDHINKSATNRRASGKVKAFRKMLSTAAAAAQPLMVATAAYSSHLRMSFLSRGRRHATSSSLMSKYSPSPTNARSRPAGGAAAWRRRQARLIQYCRFPHQATRRADGRGSGVVVLAVMREACPRERSGRGGGEREKGGRAVTPATDQMMTAALMPQQNVSLPAPTTGII